MTGIDYEGEQAEECIGLSEGSSFDTLIPSFRRVKDSNIICRNIFCLLDSWLAMMTFLMLNLLCAW